ncbi:helix-turn-helix domain-containing protein [Paenibacillus sp. P36]|uniref:helix-turn-helix domain-containing protein n=1 Tax=Paenibacillus sp. P36 TaxID=3342538 RepID=UPI0038B277A4
MMENRKIPLFHSYLLSYVIVLLIPILIIGLLVYQRFVIILQEEITIGHRHVLEQARSTFEAKLTEMNKIAIEVSNKPELSPDRLKKSMSYAIDAMGALQYTTASPFVHQIMYYLKDSPYLYTPSTTIPITLFAEGGYGIKTGEAGRILQDLGNLTKPVLKPAAKIATSDLQTSNRALTYLIPIPYNSPKPYGALIFLINEDSVGKLLEGTLEERHGNSLIINRDGQIIAALRHEAYIEDPSFLQVVLNVSNGMQIAEFDHVSYAISTLKEGHDGWTYVTMLPENDFMTKVVAVKAQFFLYVLIALLIGSVLIYVLMRWNYRPIQLLKAKLIHTKIAARNQLLLDLLRGRVSDIVAWNREGSDCGASFEKPLYFVVLIDSAEASGVDSAMQDNKQFEDVCRTHFESYVVETADESRSTVICAITQEEEGDWNLLLAGLHLDLAAVYGKITIGVGELYSDSSRVGRSYIEAATALDYKLIKGSNTLITYSEVKADNFSSSWYPKDELELLMAQMQHGEAEKAEQVLKQLHDQLLQHPVPLPIARCICYDLMGCMIKAQYKLHGPQFDKMAHQDVVSLARFSTIQDLTELVREMCLSIKRQIESGKALELEGAEAWIAYIREHYQDHNFSVQIMADHFSISRSYLNTAFKKQTDQTIIDLLDHYRLEKAKELLAGSDLGLRDIVQQIGYYDVSSFIRKFKLRLHMTPGEFRKLYAASVDSVESS